MDIFDKEKNIGYFLSNLLLERGMKALELQIDLAIFQTRCTDCPRYTSDSSKNTFQFTNIKH